MLNAVVGKLDELDQRIVEDQRMVKATEKWSACLAGEGYRYDDADTIDEDLLNRFRAILGPTVRPGATAPPAAGSSYDRVALSDLQREEVKIANVDLACETREITPVEKVVRPQYEKAFRLQNDQLLARVPASASAP